MTLEAILRHPFGGPVVVAALMLLLVLVSKATGYLFDWIGQRLDYWSIRREMRQEAESQERRRLESAAMFPSRPWWNS